MWGPDIAVVSRRKALFQFTLATLGFVGFGFLVKTALVPDRPAVPRQYPFSGLVNELGGMEQNKASLAVPSEIILKILIIPH
jgi:NADH dehydrogenase (ubiquinone) 1 beta subcomplex subunit 8